MATQTDHMKLTKPAYTDSADIAVINSNMDAIDTATSKILPVISGTTNNSGYTIASGEYFEANGKLYKANASIPTNQAWSSSATEQSDNGAINALNGKFATHTIGLDQTKANIESALASYGSTLGDNEIKPIIFSISTASAPFTNAVYMGTIKRFGNNSRYAVEVQSLSSAQSGNIITGLYASSWSWSEVALKSETPKLVASEQIVSGSSKTYSLSTGQLYQIMCGHPYGQGYFAIYAGGSAGSARLTEIKTSTNVTVSVASNANSITINAVGQATYVRIVEY